MGRPAPVVPQSGKPKTTPMNKREKKPANKTDSPPSVYPKGYYEGKK